MDLLQPFHVPATAFSWTYGHPFHIPTYTLFMDLRTDIFMDMRTAFSWTYVQPFDIPTYSLFMDLRTAFSWTCVQPFHGPMCTLFMDLRTALSWTYVQPFCTYVQLVFSWTIDPGPISIQPLRGPVYSLFTDDGPWTFMDNS